MNKKNLTLVLTLVMMHMSIPVFASGHIDGVAYFVYAAIAALIVFVLNFLLAIGNLFWKNKKLATICLIVTIPYIILLFNFLVMSVYSGGYIIGTLALLLMVSLLLIIRRGMKRK